MYEIRSSEPKFDKTECLSVPEIENNVPYEYFFNNFMLQNKPCIIKNIAENWIASKKWTKDNKPNLVYLLEKYGNKEICVSNCDQRYFNAQQTSTFLFEEYVMYWEKYIESGYSKEYPSLYLKDWHLKKKTDEDFYVIPKYFASDWINEYFTEKNLDDYMFVYMGPKGTWTPFHVDVFTSFSWSTNICGKKRWLLFPPGEEQILKDHLGNLPYDISDVKQKTQHIEVIQNSGDAIFVPSGWHHQVWNLEDTISINHNWINGCNIIQMWNSIVDNLNAVKKEISDCKDMENWIEHCQVVLKASHGIDFYMFYDFISYIANKRITQPNNKQFSGWIIGTNHAKFDVIKIHEVLQKLIKHEDFCDIKFVDNNYKPDDLIKNIKEFLSK